MQATKSRILTAYQESREFLKTTLGETPEEYRILLLNDSDLHTELALVSRKTATPHGIPTSQYGEKIREIRRKYGLPENLEITVNSKPTLAFISKESLDNSDHNVSKARLIHVLAHAYLNERTISRYPELIYKIYRMDYLQKELFLNNVVALVKERNAAWAWQYFQDFTALLRIYAEYNLAEFYTPPPTVKRNSVFYNYLIEALKLAKDRGKVLRSVPLHELVAEGFAHWATTEFLSTLDEETANSVIFQIKDIFLNPFGVVGEHLLRKAAQAEETSVEELAPKLYSDQDLLNFFEPKQLKEEMQAIRVKTSEKAIQWHGSPASYWSDLWPLHALEFDKVENYARQIQRYKFKNYRDLIERNPVVKHHGYVKVSDRKIHVFTINNDEVGLSQLLILRNHLLETRQNFITTLPGLPDIIVLKSYSSMSMANYLTVGYASREPKTPYDLPRENRAVIVSKTASYKSELEPEPPELPDEIDYSELKDITSPQRNAIRYLLRFTKRFEKMEETT